MSEHDEQAAVIKWFSLKYPDYEKCLIAYPSGAIIGGRNKWGLIAKLKKEGWRKGVPDLFLAVPAGGFNGLWIEMKDAGKTRSSVSAEQLEHLDLMAKMGYFAIWCAGATAAIETIDNYLSS